MYSWQSTFNLLVMLRKLYTLTMDTYTSANHMARDARRARAKILRFLDQYHISSCLTRARTETIGVLNYHKILNEVKKKIKKKKRRKIDKL